MAIGRNRVQYGSEALFVNHSATGYHYTGLGGVGLNVPSVSLRGAFALYLTPPYPTIVPGTGYVPNEGWRCGVDEWPPLNPSGTLAGYGINQGSIVTQLKRIQSISYGFSPNLTDVNQYGHLSRVDQVSVEAPAVTLEFSYYLLDGFNERQIGLIIDGATQPMEMEASGGEGKNYFIETVPEGRDVVGGDIAVSDSSKTVIGIGNGLLTNYTVNLSVDSFPTADVSMEGYNIAAQIGSSGLDIPGVNPKDGSILSDAWLNGVKGACDPSGCTGLFTLPAASMSYSGCGSDIAALRPGDIVIDLQNAGVLSKQVSGDGSTPVGGSAHIQSATINFPLRRTELKRLGSTYGFTRTLDVPITVTLNVSALVADLKDGKMLDLLCGCDMHDLTVTLYDPACAACDRNTNNIALQYTLKEAVLESENISSSIGDNATVDLVFTAQL